MNARMTWQTIKGALRAERAVAPLRPSQAFWEDFHARVTLHPQRAWAPRRAAYRPYGWLAAGGALAAAAFVASLYLLGGGTVPVGGSVVRSYSVGVKHSAVVLLTDQSAKATILWVAGMESAGKGEL